MKLPRMDSQDGIVKATQTRFGGLNHTLGAADGELFRMRNLTSDDYPVLSTRARRTLLRKLNEPGGIFCWEDLCWVDGTDFYFAGEKKGELTTAGEKSFAALGAYIVIFPDKAYYNTLSGQFGFLEARWEGFDLTFTNGLLFEEEAEANTIQCAGINWEDYFQVGDCVQIEGCTVHPENNISPVIRAIDGDKLYFYEYIFQLDGEDGVTPYDEVPEEGRVLSITRTAPDLKYVCENGNRLWGCDRDTIYASKLGDIFNWNVFEGLETDSYAVDTGSDGVFTGCISYMGYPMFFKEEHIYKVYGTMPSNFQVMASASLGVADGSGASLAIAGETLFYLSLAGVMAYTGGIPQCIGMVFGPGRHSGAVAGSDGLKYYISMKDESGQYLLHVYDTQRGLWHTEDETRVTYFARRAGYLCFLNDAGEIWSVGAMPDAPEWVEATEEAAFDWAAEFGDFTQSDPNKKGVGKIQIRLELDEGATVQVWIQFDTDGVWRPVDRALHSNVKRSYYLPIVPRRGDHYRIKLEGTGGCRVYSLAREYYSGSELRSLPGRN